MALAKLDEYVTMKVPALDISEGGKVLIYCGKGRKTILLEIVNSGDTVSILTDEPNQIVVKSFEE